jgi:hypothetical protein
MYGWSEGGVSYANIRIRHNEVAHLYAHKTPFGCLDTKIRSGFDMKPNLLMKCLYFCFYEIYQM